jgi:hypothetical protein
MRIIKIKKTMLILIIILVHVLVLKRKITKTILGNGKKKKNKMRSKLILKIKLKSLLLIAKTIAFSILMKKNIFHILYCKKINFDNKFYVNIVYFFFFFIKFDILYINSISFIKIY